MADVGTFGPPPIEQALKKRRGCLGCGMGCFTRVLLVLGLLVVLAVFAQLLQGVLYPWSFYLGGHFHWLPGWQGTGRIHTASGDYTIYFWIEPARGGRTYNLPTFRGSGMICTPRGERYKLRAYAGLTEKTGLDTNGKTMTLELRHRPWNYSFLGSYDQRPRLHFRGTWQNPDLVMDDGGTLAEAFDPNGQLSNNKNNYYHADSPNKVQVTFHEEHGLFVWWNGCGK